MNKLITKIKQYINQRIDYYKTRSNFKKGNKLYAIVTFPELKCECDDCINNYQRNILLQVIDIAYDVKEKYNLQISYDYKIGRVNDNFINNTIAVKVTLEKDDFADQRTLEELKYYE